MTVLKASAKATTWSVKEMLIEDIFLFTKFSR